MLLKATPCANTNVLIRTSTSSGRVFSGTQNQYNGGMSMHKYEGSHAVVAVGYDDNENYFIILKGGWLGTWGIFLHAL